MALKSLTQAERELGISRKTLLKHIRRAGMEVQNDLHDERLKLLTDDQIDVLREVVTRIKGK